MVSPSHFVAVIAFAACRSAPEWLERPSRSSFPWPRICLSTAPPGKHWECIRTDPPIPLVPYRATGDCRLSDAGYRRRHGAARHGGEPRRRPPTAVPQQL